MERKLKQQRRHPLNRNERKSSVVMKDAAKLSKVIVAGFKEKSSIIAFLQGTNRKLLVFGYIFYL